MAKATSSFSEVQIARRIKEGRGKDYIPWLTVQEVPSLDRSAHQSNLIKKSENVLSIRSVSPVSKSRNTTVSFCLSKQI